MPDATAVWIGRVMSGMLAAMLGFSGIIKLMGRPEVAETLVPRSAFWCSTWSRAPQCSAQS